MCIYSLVPSTRNMKKSSPYIFGLLCLLCLRILLRFLFLAHFLMFPPLNWYIIFLSLDLEIELNCCSSNTATLTTKESFSSMTLNHILHYPKNLHQIPLSANFFLFMFRKLYENPTTPKFKMVNVRFLFIPYLIWVVIKTLFFFFQSHYPIVVCKELYFHGLFQLIQKVMDYWIIHPYQILNT